MEIQGSNHQGEHDPKIDYVAPYDVRELAMQYSVTSKAFSLALLTYRLDRLPVEDCARALKTIRCLDTGEAFR